VKTALKLGSCKIINIKQGRVGGPEAAMAIHDLCAANDIPVWAGGMLETGIGRSLNIALASLDNFVLPGDISASDRYWKNDIITPPVTFSEPGRLKVPDSPGRGYEIDQDYLDSFTAYSKTINLS
jgi:O-succinylbenzoate synthase